MKNIALICGGKSPEHEISVRSAREVLAAIDRSKFSVTLIGIDRAGSWRLLEESQLDKAIEPGLGIELAILPGRGQGQIIQLHNKKAIPQPEAIFLILHGPMGEDGTVQGLLRVLDLPFIGPDVLGSAVAMDKEFAKRLLKEAGVNVARGLVFEAKDQGEIYFDHIEELLGMPVFVKPANMGSSVGVHKVETAEQLKDAVKDAFLYDRKILIEEMILGRELECAVMGNQEPIASTVGEVVTEKEYSYEAKYLSQTSAKIVIPAEVSEEELILLRSNAKKAYRALGCEVLSRVDMFLTNDGDVYVNEINTLPGFTSISMYPKLWEAEGVSYPDLIERLLNLAVERHAAQKALRTNF
jgi:D-alanine-D-alanine ligase